jgi:hypothetical protein
MQPAGATADGVTLQGALLGHAPVLLPAAQVRQLLGPGDVLVNAHRSTVGVVWCDDGAVRLQHAGAYEVCRGAGASSPVTAATDLGGKATLRTAQYICGMVGIVIVNFVLFYDTGDRGANAKDFLINFASDILAVGAVLFIAELVDRTKGRNGQAAPDGNLYEMPITASTTIQ